MSTKKQKKSVNQLGENYHKQAIKKAHLYNL